MAPMKTTNSQTMASIRTPYDGDASFSFGLRSTRAVFD